MTLTVRCLALCAAAAFAFSPKLAHAQDSDTLPTLDDSTPVVAPPEPVAPVPPVVVTTIELLADETLPAASAAVTERV